MSVKDQIGRIVKAAVHNAQRRQLLPASPVAEISIERPHRMEHGDFATSLPLKLARQMRMSPMAIAEAIAPLIPLEGLIGSISVERPGFINFALRPGWLAEQVDVIRRAGETYGNVDVGEGKRVQIDYVSINPTGPLHVGHARGAVLGSTLANILTAGGYQVVREYYINDSGNQMDRFYQSLYARYLQLFGREANIPEDGYRGEYIVDLARELKSEQGDRYLEMPESEAIRELGEIGLLKTIDLIREDLVGMRVEFDVWFSERGLYTGGQYETAMGILDAGGHVTDREGARWFAFTALGEGRDTVLVRSNGAPTYFASDVAYHYNKFFERGFDLVVDIWGADHQGHVPKMEAVAGALGVEQGRLRILIYQLVTLKRGDEVVRFSKRTGEVVTLRELVEEVGADACRYFFLSRSAESQMEFDLELAKVEAPENPVYYIQYAHARIAGILRLARERGIDHTDGDLSLLGHEAELALVRKMLAFPELIEVMVRSLEPHHLPHYAVELATDLQRFYEQCRVVSSRPEDLELTRARLKLVEAARIVLARCLALMIMRAPERM